jgi:hypothetical protein
MTIDRAALLKPLPVKKERVDLPEFGQDAFVMVHGMNAREKNAHDASMMNRKYNGLDPKKVKNQKERLVICCTRDENGEPILQPGDVDAVGNWPADVLNRVFDVASRLSGGSSDENAVKNSGEIGDE